MHVHKLIVAVANIEDPTCIIHSLPFPQHHLCMFTQQCQCNTISTMNTYTKYL
jgi:hypothetical protein